MVFHLNHNVIGQSFQSSLTGNAVPSRFLGKSQTLGTDFLVLEPKPNSSLIHYRLGSRLLSVLFCSVFGRFRRIPFGSECCKNPFSELTRLDEAGVVLALSLHQDRERPRVHESVSSRILRDLEAIRKPGGIQGLALGMLPGAIPEGLASPS
jgi:hypothetical protein